MGKKRRGGNGKGRKGKESGRARTLKRRKGEGMGKGEKTGSGKR